MVNVPIYYDRQRLKASNIKDYLKKKYPGYDIISSLESFRLETESLLQKNYGEDLDCTLTSITECTMYYSNGLIDTEVYPIVEQFAKKCFYNGKQYGTIPVFIKNI